MVILQKAGEYGDGSSNINSNGSSNGGGNRIIGRNFTDSTGRNDVHGRNFGGDSTNRNFGNSIVDRSNLNGENRMTGRKVIVSGLGASKLVVNNTHLNNHHQQNSNQVMIMMPDGSETSLEDSNGIPSSFIIKEEEDPMEYTLPADEEAWAQIFSQLELRLSGSLGAGRPFTERQRNEAEQLLPLSRTVVHAPVSEQVKVFQQLCILTNTTI